jgi:peptidoglycan hydrolase-like protein with peptidoglycan-binding domain
MKGSDFLKTLPKTMVEAQAAIEKAIFDGLALPFDWTPIRSEYNGHQATLFVTSDCIRIGEHSDFLRVPVTARTAQHVADHYSAYLPTTRIADLIYQQASVKAEPCLFGEPRASSSRIADYTKCTTQRVGTGVGLVEVVGKHWVLTNRLLTSNGKVANYGFYSKAAPYVSPSGLRMWQTLGLAHNAGHVDYSQTLRLVGGTVQVDGKQMTFAQVASDPALARLVSDEGLLRTLRIPGITRPDGLVQPLEIPPLKHDLSFSRNLTVGSEGDDVKLWQAFVRVATDGKFGPITKGATLGFQIVTGLPATGVVEAKTVQAANDELARRLAMNSGSLIPVDTYVQAKHYQAANRQGRNDVHWIVIHTIETAEKGTAAEACAEYFRQGPRVASAHYCIDDDSIVQCVQLKDVAYAAPGVNKYGVQLEHAGFARQSVEEWEDAFSRAMLERSAKLAAQRIAPQFQIPTRYISRVELIEAKKYLDKKQPVPDHLRGVTTHNEVSQAFHQSDHYDPGPHFPMEQYLEWMSEAA